MAGEATEAAADGLRIRVEGALLRLTLARPGRLNAIDQPMGRALIAAFGHALEALAREIGPVGRGEGEHAGREEAEHAAREGEHHAEFRRASHAALPTSLAPT